MWLVTGRVPALCAMVTGSVCTVWLVTGSVSALCAMVTGYVVSFPHHSVVQSTGVDIIINITIYFPAEETEAL